LLKIFSYTLPDNVENLVLTGTFAINGTGNEENKRIIGNLGNNMLDGGAGADVMFGGTGNDTYMVDDTSDHIIEQANEGTDLVNSSVSYVLDANDYIKIAGEFQQTNYGIERLEVSNGHYITRQDIQTIVDTMSSINNNSGMDVMQKYAAMMSDQQYQNILTASWHQ
jgi:Ca2+-binding RTX toxin-like protein